MSRSKIAGTVAVAALVAALGLGANVAPAGEHGRGHGASHGMMHGGGHGMMPRFGEMDTDGDGTISRDEMRAARAARFAGMDDDGDGKVTRDEIVAHMQARMAERFGRMADRMIRHQDADGDGAIAEGEFGRVDRMEMMFDRVDRDGDGSVSTDEAKSLRAMHAQRRGHGRHGSGEGHDKRHGHGHGKDHGKGHGHGSGWDDDDKDDE